MKDVINTYRPDVFWTDGEWDQSAEAWKSKEFLTWMYNESPVKDQVVTYDRWGTGVRFKHGGVFTPEYQPDLNFEEHYWEESRGMGFSYGYNREEDAWDYNSAQALVLQLIDKVSGGGNFLLDIGPDEHGKIPPIMQERLQQIGDWMKINQESIYNTVRWRTSGQWSEGSRDYKPKSGSGDLLLKVTVDPDPGYAVKECFFTFNPSANNLYAILPIWPSDKKFIIRDLSLGAATLVELMETHQKLEWEQQGGDIVIHLPEFDPNKIKSRYAFVIKLSNTGAFAPAPHLELSYPGNSLTPLISVSAKEGYEYRYTLDGSVPNASSALYKTAFHPDRSGELSMRSFKQGILPGNAISMPVTLFKLLPASSPSGVQKGLKLAAYELKAESVNELSTATPVKETLSQAISLKDLTRDEYAGLLYTGYIKAPADGLYDFYLSSDDGSKLWIDGQPVIDHDGLHSNTEKSGKIALKKGNHTFKLAYIQDKSTKALKLEYSIGQQGRQLVPASFFWSDK
jgi:hypothetical protein